MQKEVHLEVGMMCGGKLPSMKRSYHCDHCEADFKISHQMEEEYYEVNFCPFCSAQIDDEKDEEEDNE